MCLRWVTPGVESPLVWRRSGPCWSWRRASAPTKPAAFLSRALGLDPGPDAFTDDVGGTFESEINALAAAGITRGCTVESFCPDEQVTRAQMASFLVRAGLPD
ncbi:MAG: S-layer homology domain-containing protein [Acidimicrobiia bacterium]